MPQVGAPDRSAADQRQARRRARREQIDGERGGGGGAFPRQGERVAEQQRGAGLAAHQQGPGRHDAAAGSRQVGGELGTEHRRIGERREVGDEVATVAVRQQGEGLWWLGHLAGVQPGEQRAHGAQDIDPLDDLRRELRVDHDGLHDLILLHLRTGGRAMFVGMKPCARRRSGALYSRRPLKT